MRCVVQRSGRASVKVDGDVVGTIDRGLVVLVGFRDGDGPDEIERIAEKLLNLRIFEDSDGRMNLSIRDAGGEVLCISQFTLYADVRRGNRPSFDGAAPGAVAEPLYKAFCEAIRSRGVACAEGLFGADMQVSLTNDGPVTIILDSDDLARPRRA